MKNIILITLIAGVAFGFASYCQTLGKMATEREKTKRLEMLIKAGWTNHLNQVQ